MEIFSFYVSNPTTLSFFIIICFFLQEYESKRKEEARLQQLLDYEIGGSDDSDVDIV